MPNEDQVRRFVVDYRGVTEQFPTHRHEPEFWEALGRCVGTFGFLEEILGKAIFAFTATRPYSEGEIEQAYLAWLPQLERALTDQLGGLICNFEKAVRNHPMATISNLDELVDALRKASTLRNVICHGSWGAPDSNGATVPLFVSREKEVFETAIDRHFLVQLQEHVAELTSAVINTVTHMGWQFPGSNGPGKVVWSKK